MLLAEIGVALLLFGLRVDFDLREIRQLQRISPIGTSLQFFIAIIFGFLIGQLSGRTFPAIALILENNSIAADPPTWQSYQLVYPPSILMI